jgi:large subunit ribosomal protein L2
MALYKLPLGSQVHNLEINPGQGGKLIRSAGNSGQIIEKELEKGYARIKLPSGSERWVPLTCRAT